MFGSNISAKFIRIVSFKFKISFPGLESPWLITDYAGKEDY